MVNLELYKVFYTVAKCGSLTKAAQELYISQPAVSQAVKQLENQLGVVLFNRTHKGMELTAGGGKIIFNNVEQALKLIGDAENAIGELNATATGCIRIGATDSIFTYVIAEQLAKFNAKYPAVKLELISSTSPYTLSQLKDGKCDVAFLNLPADDDDIRFFGTVAHITDVFVAGEKYSALKGQTLPLQRLREFSLLMIEENTIARRALAATEQTLGVELRPDIEVANWDIMKTLAAKGMGIGCIPREYCLREFESGELFELNVSPALPVRGIGVALAKNANLSFAMKELLSMFTDEIK